MISKERAFKIFSHCKVINLDDNGFVFHPQGYCEDEVFTTTAMGEGYTININKTNCKLILRPLSELTGKEILEFWHIRKPKAERISVPYTDFTKLSPQETEYLISIGIDIFNLKERGWAVYEVS